MSPSVAGCGSPGYSSNSRKQIMIIHTDPNTLIQHKPKEAIVQEPTQQPPEWAQVLSMFDALFGGVLKYAEPLIKHRVDAQIAPLVERIAALEQRLENITTASDERIREIAIEEVEEQMAAHHNSYDHDEYDRLVGDLEDKVNDAINDYDFEDKVRDALRELSFTVTVD